MNRQNLLRFLESSSDPGDQIWIVGVPYDGTSSYKPGARFAPDEVRRASDGIESYSPYTDRDLKDLSIYDYGNLEISFSSPEKVYNEIHTFYSKIIPEGKKICTIGGEHSITFPIVMALLNYYPNLKLIHLDAHADMREEYGGSKLSHASIIRRILDTMKPENYFGFGIRSGLKESFERLKNLKNFFPFSIENLYRIKELIDDNSPVYITLDLDILDPAFLPGTGAPEPKGISTHELHDAILNIRGLNIVGFDVVELSPPCDPSGISSVTAAFFIRELLLLI